MARIFRTSRQRAASKRNLIKARIKRTRAHDTLGYYFRMGIRATANAGSGGKASTVSNFIEGKHRKKPNKYYKDRSGKRKRKR